MPQVLARVMSIAVPTQALVLLLTARPARSGVMLKNAVMHAVRLKPAADVVAGVRVVLVAVARSEGGSVRVWARGEREDYIWRSGSATCVSRARVIARRIARRHAARSGAAVYAR